MHSVPPVCILSQIEKNLIVEYKKARELHYSTITDQRPTQGTTQNINKNIVLVIKPDLSLHQRYDCKTKNTRSLSTSLYNNDQTTHKQWEHQ